MATGTNDLLNRLRKLLAEAADTAQLRQPWQELFGRQDSVPPRAIRAAEAVKDFAGSWAASYTLGHGKLPSQSDIPAPISGFDSRLGRRGYPEINFVPYAWNTNAQGDLGLSLVGHPVSFEVQGPTLKNSKLASEEWEVIGPRELKFTGGDVSTFFDFTNIALASTPHWLVVTDPGGPLYDPITKKVSKPTTVDFGSVETEKHRGTARYELFRIKEIQGDRIHLEGPKTLSEYFTSEVDGKAKFKAVTILKAKTARLIPVRDSNNKSLIVVPPSHAASDDVWMTRGEWAGQSEDYLGRGALPIPRPIPISASDTDSDHGTFKAQMNHRHTGSPQHLGNAPVGRFRINVGFKVQLLLKDRLADDQTTIVHIAEVALDDNPTFPATCSLAKHALGYFEVVGVGVTLTKQYFAELRYHNTTNPETGVPFFLPATALQYDGASDAVAALRCTLHDTISSLYNESRTENYDADALDSARLTGLIDPKEVGRSLKVHGTNDVPGGGGSGRADRAIPNTQHFTDPGSLLDLGFRMVLFSAKRDSEGKSLPDYAKPLASHELILDPGLDEAQYVDIDYASGVVKFSHTPKEGGDISFDKKGQPLLYAAFVPYSMEGGQRGSSVRMTGGDIHSANLGYPNPAQQDVFSGKKALRHLPKAVSYGWGDTITLLRGSYEADSFPKTGHVTIASQPSGLPYIDTQEAHPKADLNVYYDGITEQPEHILLHNISFSDGPHPTSSTITLTQDMGVFFRHRGDLDHRFDTTYGSSARTDVVRLAYGNVTYNLDGSMTVMPTAVAGPAEELRAFFPLGNHGDGKTSEVSRFHFDTKTQRWSTDDPPWLPSGHQPAPDQKHEIGIEVSRGRLYTHWESSPASGVFLRRVAGAVEKIESVTNDSFKQAVPNGFSLQLRGGTSTGDWNASDVFSAQPSLANLLSAVLEGSTISSVALDPEEKVYKQLRFGFALKRNAPQEWWANQPPSDKRKAEAASNPLYWATATSDGIKGYKELCAVLNYGDHASGNNGLRKLVNGESPVDFEPKPTAGGEQYLMEAHGRQIQALPESPYLTSGLKFPIKDFKDELRVILDLRSADPLTPTAWLHYEMVIPEPAAPIDFPTAVELADYLNKKGLYSDETLKALGNANFLQDITDKSENPELIALTPFGPPVRFEHQLIFVAWTDARLPVAGGEQLALLCGGRGVSLQIESEFGGAGQSGLKGLQIAHETAAPFHNVLLELRPSARTAGTTSGNLLRFLQGDFDDRPKTMVRCGLFYGDNSLWPAGSPYPTSANVGAWDHYLLALKGNTKGFGFGRSGTRPLGRYAGSFPITNFGQRRTHTGTITSFDVKFPTGAMADWFNDQSFMGAKGLHVAIQQQPAHKFAKLAPSINDLTVGEAGLQAWDHPASGWAGRWSWPWDAPEILPEADIGKEAGITNVYVTFGVEEFNEHAFKYPLRSRYSTGHTSYLLETKPVEPSEWDQPETVWEDIAFGDIVSFGATKNKKENVLIEGRVFAKHADKPNLYVLAGPRNRHFDGTSGDIYGSIEGFGSPDQMLRPLDSYGSIWSVDPIGASIVPSPLGGSHAAVAHMVHNRNMDVSVQDQGFFGGSSATPSSVLVGAGRVSLFSSMGALEPTGFALHNVLHGYREENSLNPDTFSQSSVYVESGAFTTTVGGHWKVRGSLETQGFWTDRKRANKITAGTQGFAKETPRIGGVGGVRISGDAHLWLRNIRPLRSRYATAFPRKSGDISGRFDVSAGHLPSQLTTLAPDGLVVQETTIQIALTGVDMLALRGAVGGDYRSDWRGDPVTGESDYTNYAALGMGQIGYHMGQMGLASQPPILMPSLVGSYLRLEDFPIVPVTGIANEPSFGPSAKKWSTGLFRIVSAPVLTSMSTPTEPVSGEYPNMLQSLGRPSAQDDASSPGRQRESQVVATLLIRIEGFKVKNYGEFVAAKESAYKPVEGSPIGDDWQRAGEGLFWGVFRDPKGAHPIMAADVVDPGGAPTGAPTSLRGMTLDPQIVAGKSSLSAELIPLYSGGLARPHSTDEGYVADPLATPLFEQTGCELLGVHDQVGRFGQHFSRAFFAVNDSKFMNSVEDYGVQTKPFSARMVILADSAGLVDGVKGQSIQGEFVVDPETGRINHHGYPRRLGPGVIMDGGLGLVQATAFRATPRSREVENIGQLTVWGRGAWPYYNGLKPADVGVELPSTFNTVEFHGEMSVASPQGRIVFESPWAAHGLAANMLAAEAGSQVYFGPASSGHMALDLVDIYAEAQGSTAGISTLKSGDTSSKSSKALLLRKFLGLGISDTLFPHISSGLVFRAPGTTVYERSFRSLDATGKNPYRKARMGSHNRSGIAGMGIPVQGEVLLLPQGPTSKGVGRANQNVGVDPKTHASGGGITPIDIPLYEFTNSTISSIYFESSGGLVGTKILPNARLDISPFGFNAASLFQSEVTTGAAQFPGTGNYGAPCISSFDKGHHTHFGQPGAISQAYRHSISREDEEFFNKDGALVQMRLLDGMVIEDTTNGTFYTVGSVGRFQNLKNASTSLGVLGDGVRSPTNGSVVAQSVRYTPYYNPFDPPNPFTRYSTPEVIYDLSENFDPDVEREPFSDDGISNGFGDRVDHKAVRRPLAGHNIRITPNVEFVPVLGPRGVTGGLTESVYYTFDRRSRDWVSHKVEADALFYDLNHRFVSASPETGEGDVGRMLYICGTHTYAHTGWYTIVDVLEDWQEVDRADLRDGFGIYAHPEHTSRVKSLALLRKYNWSDSQRVPLTNRAVDSRSDDHTGWFPLRPRAPYVSSVSDRRTNCGDQRGHFGLVRESTPPSGAKEWLEPSYDNLHLNFHLAEKVVGYAGMHDGFSTNPLLFSTSINKEDMVAAHVKGNNFDYTPGNTPPPLALTSEAAALFLNTHDRANGRFFLQTVFPAAAVPLTGFIRWTVRGDVLSAHYDLAALDAIPAVPFTKVVGGAACFQVHWRTRRDISHIGEHPEALGAFGLPYTSPIPLSHNVYDGPLAVGFSKDIGHSCGVDRSVGDRNNALPMPYIGYLNQDPNGIYSTATTVDTDLVFPVMPVQSAARGLRWVFSHPLSEENAGSYVHLTRPHIHRFGSLLPSQKIGETTTLMHDSTWTSGHQRRLDVEKSEGRLDLRTDIFRINRCPTTTKLIVGGDCETFFPEFSSSRMFSEIFVKGEDVGHGRPIMYAPLGVYGHWPDTDDPSLLGNAAYTVQWPMRYALQPIAREKIITISPSSASSSKLMTRGHSDTMGGNTPIGPQGVGLGIAVGNSQPSVPEAAFSLEPWQLVSRTELARTNSMPMLAKMQNHLLGSTHPDYYDSRVEINNANFEMWSIGQWAAAFSVDFTQGFADIVATLTDIIAAITPLLNAFVGLINALVDMLVAFIQFLMADIDLSAALAHVVSTNYLALSTELEDLQGDLSEAKGWLIYLTAKEAVLQGLINKSHADHVDSIALVSKYTASVVVITAEIATITADIAALDAQIVAVSISIATAQTHISDEQTLLNQTLQDLQDLDWNLDHEADHYLDDAAVSSLLQDRKAHLALIQKWTEQRNQLLSVKSDYQTAKSEKQVLLAALTTKLPLVQAMLVAAEAQEQANGIELDALKDKYKHTDWQAHSDAMYLNHWDTVFPAMLGQFESETGDNYCYFSMIDVAQRWGSDISSEIALKSAQITAEANAVVDPVTTQTLAWLLSDFHMKEAFAEQAIEIAYVKLYELETLIAEIILLFIKFIEALMDLVKLLLEAMMEGQLFGSVLTDQTPKDSTYMWSPAGEWWQLYQPAWAKHGPGADHPPPTLKVDLTESFTQAIAPGSGLNSPHPGRAPRGVRLNRIWVNFGVWGNDPAVANPVFSGPVERRPWETPGYPEELENNSTMPHAVLDTQYMSFNLILEIPGSQARVFDGKDKSVFAQSSGNTGFPFGGRAPTSGATHDSNSLTQQAKYPGGTIVIPLYCNREAGDMMPNTMERFVTAGPKPDKVARLSWPSGDPIPNPKSDWSGGYYEYGFGTASQDPDDSSYYDPNPLGGSGSFGLSAHLQPWDVPDLWLTLPEHMRDANIGLFVNSYNPVLWGGMDFARWKEQATELDGVFSHAKYSRVQASVFPRQSRTGGGLRSSFTSGLIPSGKAFSSFWPQSLSAATLTGITVAHSGTMPPPPTAEAGSYSKANLEGGYTCPHGFTIALTPVGDFYHEPVGELSGGGVGRLPIHPTLATETSSNHPLKPHDPRLRVGRYGRQLETLEQVPLEQSEMLREMRVGNWLELILERYGIPAASGSMLPPGARVYLEVAVGPGNAARSGSLDGSLGAGAWVGNIKLSFDVETADGTAWTTDVNVLGDEEG